MILVPSIDIGGAERFTCVLANHLSRSEFDVHLVVTGHPETIYELREDLNFQAFSIQKARNAIFKIRTTILEIEPDIVFSTFGYFNLLLSIFRPLFPRHIKFIGRESMVLKNKLKMESSKLGALFYINLAKRFLPKLDALVCQSKDMDNSLKELGIHHPNVAIINNPVNVALAEERFKVPVEESYDIVSVGRLSPQKGFDRMIEILHLYQQKYDANIRVGIIGDGQEKEKIAALIKEKQLTENVFLLGVQSNVYKYYKKAKLFLMTSHFEGFPNVLVEALVCGLPIVAFRVPGGINEIIQEGVNGFSVVDNDWEQMATTLQQALTHSFDREKIKSNSINTYSTERIIRKYEELITKVQSSNKSSIQNMVVDTS